MLASSGVAVSGAHGVRSGFLANSILKVTCLMALVCVCTGQAMCHVGERLCQTGYELDNQRVPEMTRVVAKGCETMDEERTVVDENDDAKPGWPPDGVDHAWTLWGAAGNVTAPNGPNVALWAATVHRLEGWGIGDYHVEALARLSEPGEFCERLATV